MKMVQKAKMVQETMFYMIVAFYHLMFAAIVTDIG